MKLIKPTYEFIEEIRKLYLAKEDNDELNQNILKLFNTFNNDKNKSNVLIKVAALNKIYSTSIVNINPVVNHIIQISSTQLNPKSKIEYIEFVDKISKINWTNNKGKCFERNNLSFASKYVHFLSNFEIPIYDSYIWIVINGYLGQNTNKNISFINPKNYKEFYDTFTKFKIDFGLENHSNYEIDKFLWQYGKKLISEIQTEMIIDLD